MERKRETANPAKTLALSLILCAAWESILGIVLWHGGYKNDPVWAVGVPVLFAVNTLILFNLPIVIRRFRRHESN